MHDVVSRRPSHCHCTRLFSGELSVRQHDNNASETEDFAEEADKAVMSQLPARVRRFVLCAPPLADCNSTIQSYARTLAVSDEAES